MISIRKQIIGIILLSVMAIAVAQGVIQFNSARAMLYDELNREYKMAVDDKAEKMNQTIKSIQFSVDQLSAVMLQMLDDAEKFKTDKSYQESYQNEVQPIVTKFAQGTFGAMTYYVRFNPEYSPGTSGLFYTDMDGNGSFEKQEPTDFSKYKPDDLEHVGWYYIPINNKKATWLDPYFNANINANMISYIVPLYKDGVTIGIVGMDINFDKFKSIMNEKKDISTYFPLSSLSNESVILYLLCIRNLLSALSRKK
jgi:methyl-accepting chemotaxis protein